MTQNKKVIEQNYFPLKTIENVVNLFRAELENDQEEPDLTLLSLVAGIIENYLATDEKIEEFPIINFADINTLYKKFQSILSSVESAGVGKGAKNIYATREIIKKVSDIIWNSLVRWNKKSDRAHLQSLYTFLNGNKLDCFGTAFAVVAGCQLLGYKDVHLAISEDHVWVVFGKTGEETIEVTWHGKVFEDKRGSSVGPGIEMQTWKYVNGNAVICDRKMEVAAIVCSINPSFSTTTMCVELADMQQKLLWLLYDKNVLKFYPSGLGCLGELEEVSPTPGRQTCEDLYHESIASARKYYKNHHVYPYCYAGSYYFRQSNYKNALKSWADAAEVIRFYNYHRDDEEIYKEFLEIANEHIPFIMKQESSGHSAHSILRSAQSFGDLLRFYDGICQWEEGSLTPILHIGWAKPLVNNISKYEYDVRSQLAIKLADFEEQKLEGGASPSENNNNNNNNILKADLDTPSTKDAKDDKLSSIVAACGEKILNPEFLLQGGGKLFTDNNGSGLATTTTATGDSVKGVSSKNEVNLKKGDALKNGTDEKVSETLKSDDKNIKKENELLKPIEPEVCLFSQKMKGLREIFLAEKLNTNAISLQITAQSQVSAKKSRGSSTSACYGSDFDLSSRPKRARRD